LNILTKSTGSVDFTARLSNDRASSGESEADRPASSQASAAKAKPMEDADGAPERTPVPALSLEMIGCNGESQKKAPLSSAAVGLALQDDQWAFEAPGEGVSPGVYRYLRGSSA
jgi:hypothetical protein